MGNVPFQIRKVVAKLAKRYGEATTIVRKGCFGPQSNGLEDGRCGGLNRRIFQEASGGTGT